MHGLREARTAGMHTCGRSKVGQSHETWGHGRGGHIACECTWRWIVMISISMNMNAYYEDELILWIWIDTMMMRLIWIYNSCTHCVMHTLQACIHAVDQESVSRMNREATWFWTEVWTYRSCTDCVHGDMSLDSHAGQWQAVMHSARAPWYFCLRTRYRLASVHQAKTRPVSSLADWQDNEI